MANATANTRGIHAEIDGELAAAFDAEKKRLGLGTTALLTRYIEKGLGRKPTKTTRKRGRPKKDATA